MATGFDDIQFKELKDTIKQLNTTIKAQTAMIVSLKETIDTQSAQNAEKDQLIANLQAQLAYLKGKLFGASSEKNKIQVPGQFSLFGDEEEQIPEVIEPEFVEEIPAKKKSRKPKATYDEMFANLQTEEVFVDTLTEEQKKCPVCGSGMIPIGHETIRTEIRFIPAKLKRINYIATTYECPECKLTEEPQFIKDEGTPALIPGSYMSESLLAWVMFQKFVNSMPLYRQEKDFLLYGAQISRGTMASGIITCAKTYFQPVYDYLKRLLKKRRFLMGDETPVQVLKEPNRRPQSKSYIWLVRTGEDGLPAIILYRYTPTRAGDNIAEFLEGMEPGYYFMVDGYSGYNKLKEAKRCCCWAHIRRYLLEAIPKGHEKDYTDPAVQGVLYCDKLFEYERSYVAKELTYKQRERRRLKDEKPVIDAFLVWLKQQRPVNGSRMDRAVTYIRNRQDYLAAYLEDGRCSLSNNLSENSIRPLTVGRKNYLFSDTQDGAEANMLVYTMIEMAKAHHINPYKYLMYLLEHRPNAEMADAEFELLMPWNEDVQKVCDISSDNKME